MKVKPDAISLYTECVECGNEHLQGTVCHHPRGRQGGRRLEAAAREYAQQVGADRPTGADRQIMERVLRAADNADQKQGVYRERRTPQPVNDREHEFVRQLREHPDWWVRLIRPANRKAAAIPAGQLIQAVADSFAQVPPPRKADQ